MLLLRRAVLTNAILLLLQLTITATAAAAANPVFVEQHNANGVLQRWRRANSGFLEELKQGNLERECIEEICSYEEAREVFEDEDKTRMFWSGYHRLDSCSPNPCQNNGTCVSMGNNYECTCPEGFEGRYCQTVFEDSLKCLYQNGQCQHFCDGSGEKRKCFCADGYKLGEDGRACIADAQFPCGQVAPKDQAGTDSVVGQARAVGSNHCPPGECPWQVLVQLNGTSHCGGALVKPDWVLTAAHCVLHHQLDQLMVVAGEQNLDINNGAEQRIPVSMAIPHPSYVAASGDSDLALLQLSRPLTLNHNVNTVCLPTRDLWERELSLVRYHTVSGWGRRTIGGNRKEAEGAGVPVSPLLRRMMVPLIENRQCSQRTNFNFTENMLCAGYLGGSSKSCYGDDGSPLVTNFGQTHFLVGVVGWGRGCSQPGYYAVYTNVANFVGWVVQTIKAPPTMQSDMKTTSPAVSANGMTEQKPIK